MIKINLLAEGKRPVVARKGRTPSLPSPSSGNLGNVLLISGIVFGLLFAGGWWLLLNMKLSNKQDQINVAQKEVDELQQVIKEVEAYKLKKAELERKIGVINQLKDNQRGPVQIMDEVSKATPELLWLTGLEATNTNVNLRGSTFNMSAIANLIDNLDRVEAFQEPVLQDWAQRRGRGVRAEAYDFRLTFPYSFKKPQPVGGESPAAPGAAPAAAPAADRR
jgi:type IV pilus assembly protein PilN